MVAWRRAHITRENTEFVSCLKPSVTSHFLKKNKLTLCLSRCSAHKYNLISVSLVAQGRPNTLDGDDMVCPTCWDKTRDGMIGCWRRAAVGLAGVI